MQLENSSSRTLTAWSWRALEDEAARAHEKVTKETPAETCCGDTLRAGPPRRALARMLDEWISGSPDGDMWIKWIVDYEYTKRRNS
jgi:hypothetical protein